MDPNTRAELDRMKREQASLEQRLVGGGMALNQEESRVKTAATNLENLRREQTQLEYNFRGLSGQIERLNALSTSPVISEATEHLPPEAPPPPITPFIAA